MSSASTTSQIFAGQHFSLDEVAVIVGEGWNKFTESVFNFVAMIDWNERWIQFLVGFHITTFTVILLFRNNIQSLFTLLCAILVLVLMSPYLNSYLSKNYHVITKFDYFDMNGFFISMIYSLPLCFNAFCCVGCLLVRALDLMARVKSGQLQNSVTEPNSVKDKNQ
ncbi:transmembrane protein 18-domain-containing protein [Paraphysoderma sedebokerense]|nr:transmembrane protein 18-domain-containing protein [Paraphysoderma sedebokerense]